MSGELVDLRVPSFGQGLDEALLVEWVAELGSPLKRGDVVAVVETVKATTDIVADRGGEVTTRAVEVGTIVSSGQVLCQLTTRPEDDTRDETQGAT